MSQRLLGRRIRKLAGAAVFLPLLAPGPSGAGQVCLVPTDGWGCFPCDLPIEMSAIGYSTEGPPCGFPAPAPAPRSHEEFSAQGWWDGLWTLSTSGQDPYVNQGPFLSDQDLHLWLVDTGCGYGFNDGYLAVQSDFRIESYEPVAAGFQQWTPQADRKGGWLDVGLGCVGAGVVGTFRISRVHRESRNVDIPLQASTGPPPTIKTGTWGSVKALYR